MNRTIPILIVGILVLSGLGAGAFSNKQSEAIEIKESVSFAGSAVFQDSVKDGYLRVSFEEANSWLMKSGMPELPIYIKNYQLPKDARNIQVACIPKNIHMMHVPGEIVPSKAVIRDYDVSVNAELVKDEQTYGSSEFYPGVWSSCRISSGLNSNDERVKFVDVICYVVRYSPANNLVEYVSDGIDISITYEYDDNGATIGDPEYDMVIIAPSKFETLLQPLIDHKISYGIDTILKTVEDILSEYDGYDAPEQIKYFIKDALDEDGLNWGITYVLLVGGLKSYLNADDKDDRNQGTTDWHVPVRYTNIQHSNEVGCPSDLYYGDIYDGEGNFSSWDSNGDGIYAKLPGDDLDLVPDVYVGRLPCRSKFEVRLMVRKIINYEKTSPDSKPWFKTMVGIAGKTFELYEGQPDGEYVCDTSIGYMGDLIDDPVRVYASNRDTSGYVPVPKDIRKAISKGAGYVDFQGHGNPVVWDTIWADGTYPEDWTGGIKLYRFPLLFNFKKLPVVIVGGCHNALFNVTIIKSLNSMDINDNHAYWTSGRPAPVCFSWGLCIVPYGGAIASTGCTGYGIGYSGQPISLSAEMETNFFYKIGQDGSTNLGNAHSGAISKFIAENEIESTEAFCITVFQLFGDPSLKLGGYE